MKYDTFFLSFSALFSRTLQSSLLWSVKNSSDLQMTRKSEFRFLEMHPFLNPWLYLKLNYPQGQFFFVIVFLVKCKWQYIYFFFRQSEQEVLENYLCIACVLKPPLWSGIKCSDLSVGWTADSYLSGSSSVLLSVKWGCYIN